MSMPKRSTRTAMSLWVSINPHSSNRGSASSIVGVGMVIAVVLTLLLALESRSARRRGMTVSGLSLALHAINNLLDMRGKSSRNSYVDSSFTILYRRGQEDLNAYGCDRMMKHFPAMLWTSKELKRSVDIGFHHESYLVRANDYECVYVNCPEMGKEGRMVPAIGKKRTARGGINMIEGSDLNDLITPE